jgi:hypothetical protein
VLALASQSLPLTSAPEPATPAAASPHASPQRKVAKPAETLAGVKKAAREQQLWPDIPRQLVEERDLMQYIQYLQMICPPNPSAGEIHEGKFGTSMSVSNLTSADFPLSLCSFLICRFTGCSWF